MEKLVTCKLIDKTRSNDIAWSRISDEQLDNYPILKNIIGGEYVSSHNYSFYSETEALFFLLTEVSRVSGVNGSNSTYLELWVIDKSDNSFMNVNEPIEFLYELKTDIEFRIPKSNISNNIEEFLNS